MILSKIYSNKTSFKKILFNKTLNIVLGKIGNTTDSDDHNLGKSKVGELIDYLLLKKVDSDNSFLKRHDIFKDYIFYLELILDKGDYLTIKRVVFSDHVSFKTTKTPAFFDVNFDEWDETHFSLTKAKETLATILNYNILQEYNFRDFINFNIRSEESLKSPLKFQKFAKEKDVVWKSKVLTLLGYDNTLYRQKIELEDKIEKAKKAISLTSKQIIQEKNQLINKNISLKSKVDVMNASYINVDFAEIDESVLFETVNVLDEEITRLNTQKYNLVSELNNLRKNFDNSIKVIDFENVRKIYDEVEIYFPEKLVKEYEELMDFNERLSTSRNNTIVELIDEKETQLKQIIQTLEDMNKSRKSNLQILKTNEVFKKMQSITKNIAMLEQEIITNMKRIDKLDSEAENRIKLDELKNSLDTYKVQLSTLINSTPSILSEVKKNLIDLSNKILNKCIAVIDVEPNKVGNPEFEVKAVDSLTFQPVSKDDGKTYNMLITSLLDIAIAISYSSKHYHHFIFHDGILEGVDQRIKVNFINEIRNICKLYGIQFIFTSIEDDISKLIDNNLVNENDYAVVLSDETDSSGTLFGFKF